MSPEEVQVILRTETGQELPVNSGQVLRRAAMQWPYIVRNRRRWADQESARDEQAKRSLEQCQELDLDDEKLREVAGSEIVEVSMPYNSEEASWQARVFPWEYVLNAATEPFRQDKSLTVIRHLDRQNGPEPAPLRSPERLLIVESAPGKLRDYFSFDSEHKLVESNLKSDSDTLKVEVSQDETPEQLRAKIRKYRPDVIHFTGCDTHQGVNLKVLKLDQEPLDGFLMKGESGLVEVVDAQRLAEMLNAADHKPMLVASSIYNSAPRICSLIVAAGAGAAIGFQDEFDKVLAELFFASFYHAWRLAEWDTLKAFQLACKMLKAQPQGLQGTGVVLWSDHSLIKPQPAAPRRRARRTEAPPAPEQVEDRMRQEREKVLTPTKSAEDARQLLPVDVKPYQSLNYSMLHNDRELFETFLIRKLETGRVNRIQVEVVLYAAGEKFPTLKSVDLVETALDLRKHIRVPLLFSLGPAIRESVHTTLYVRVTWEGHELYCDTHRVTLLPIDEWRDDDTDRVWLPSFVQPRDPAVGQIIDVAQRYLMALLDYSNAGFDGYQSVDPGTADPTEGVDLQVQALWSALVYDNLTLSYINPPPTYSFSSQRLRTPSEVIEGRRGTCIDLALLLASCLEYIDIYPVIFLLAGHAFPGYWRTWEDHQRFQEVTATVPLETTTSAGQPPGSSPTVPRYGWYLGPDTYEEVLQLVRDRKLVPIESVWLTQRGSFWEAIDEGLKNLRSKREFNAMIDIMLARRNRVTPMPLRGRP
jgi:hypothetical protein